MRKSYPIIGCLMASMIMSTANAEIAKKSQATMLKQKASIGNTVTSRKVLAQKEMAPGVVKRIVKDADGRIFTDMIRDGKLSAAPSKINRARKAPSNAAFYEGFEGHEGQLDWLPAGWTEINTPANIPTEEMCRHNINNSWAAGDTGDGYWTDITSDGIKECWIHFTYDWEYTDSNGMKVSGGPDEQDEWLVTPTISVGEGQDLYFLAEFDLGAVYNFDWGSWGYNLDIIECDLEVLASEDNGDSWKSLWKISKDVCGAMSEDDMYDAMGKLRYASYSVPLNNYYGKDIKIAFRYTNIGLKFAGNSAAVDAVTVAAPAAEAFYNLPDGSLLVGISDGLHVYNGSVGMYPAYADVIWSGSSNAYSTSNQWNFFDVDGADFYSTESNIAKVNYPYSYGQTAPWPTLTASNSSGSSTYVFNETDGSGMIFGGHCANITDDEISFLGNYDYQHKKMNTPYLALDAYVYGTHPAGIWGAGVTQTKIANLFLAPAAPLTVYDVMLTLGEYDADDDAEFLLEIFPVNAQGQVSVEPAATSVVKGSDISGFGFYNAIFHLDTPYIMDSMTIMMISGYADNPKVRTFAACAQAYNNDEYHNYAYLMFDINGQKSLLSASSVLEDYSSALILGLNGSFHFLRPEEEIVDLAAGTNDYTIAFEADNAPTDWWIVTDSGNLPIKEEGTEYDWLKIYPVVDEDNNYSLLFEADPTDNIRSKTVVLSNGGDSCRVRIRQSNTSGVASIKADSAFSVNNGILKVAGVSEDATLTVYSASGMKVLSGKNGLNMKQIGHGVYFVTVEGKTFKLAM